MLFESKDQRLLEITFISYRNHTNRMESVYKTHCIVQDTHGIVLEAYRTVQNVSYRTNYNGFEKHARKRTAGVVVRFRVCSKKTTHFEQDKVVHIL